jgi:hypothetical protein
MKIATNNRRRRNRKGREKTKRRLSEVQLKNHSNASSEVEEQEGNTSILHPFRLFC